MTTGVPQPEPYSSLPEVDDSRTPDGAAARSDGSRVRAPGRDRLAQSLGILFAALVYLAATLFGSVNSPVFGLAVVALMAKEVARSRRDRR